MPSLPVRFSLNVAKTAMKGALSFSHLTAFSPSTPLLRVCVMRTPLCVHRPFSLSPPYLSRMMVGSGKEGGRGEGRTEGSQIVVENERRGEGTDTTSTSTSSSTLSEDKRGSSGSSGSSGKKRGSGGTIEVSAAAIARSFEYYGRTSLQRKASSIRFVEIEKNGDIRERMLPRIDICTETAVEPRDLRVLDSSFRAQMPVVLPREKAIVLQLEYVRGIITAEKIMLMDPWMPTVKSIIPHLRNLTSPIEDDDRCPPFELRALEGVLIGVSSAFERQMSTLSSAISTSLDALQIEVSKENLQRLLPLKKSLSSLTMSVGEVHSAIDELLSSDEDMSEMYLTTKLVTGHRRRVDQHQEVELLLETYLKQIQEIENELIAVKSSIAASEAIAMIELDSARNQILKMDLFLSMGTFGLTSAGVVAGIFGMNLLSGLEEHPFAFYYTTGGIGTVMILFLFGSWRVMKKHTKLL